MREIADALVIFGATGDLARKKLHPALFRLAAQGRLRVPVVGVARSAWDDNQLRAYARESVLQVHGMAPDADLDTFAGHLSYVSGDYADPVTFDRLREKLGPARHPAFYFAIPPSMFPRVVGGLMGSGLNKGSRVIVEKPFGRDLASARELNASLHGGLTSGRSTGSTTTSARRPSRT